jgi:flavin reductase (DIM6/NTAB) family NADH-FMN oxidoreductase RutF
MGHFPTGVAIVTSSLEDGTPCGLTVNAFCSVSLVPPLVLVCIERIAQSHDCVLRSGVFAVNVLEGERGETLSRRFADTYPGQRFDSVSFHLGAMGCPLLDEALAWLECTVTQVVEAGDHTIFVAEVIDANAHEGSPLVFYRGGYGRFEP